jgi:uncharacterized membrane protein
MLRGEANRALTLTTAVESASPDADGATRMPRLDLDDRRNQRRWLLVKVFGGAVIFIWFGALVGFSTLLYHRFFLSEDFGAYNQAWSLIGQGHLNPFETIFQGYPFYKSDLELIIWPLALIHVVFPQPIILLWLQDLVIAGTGFVVFLWVLDFLQQRRVAWSLAGGISSIVLVMWIANPGVYETVSFDFHIEPIATFFLVMAGWSLWRGRYRHAWIWVVLTLLCGTFATITVVGLGLSAVLAGRSTRRVGVLMILAAAAWLGFISVIGANTGAGLANYAYLAGRTSLPTGTGVALILVGVLTHPSRALHVLHDRLHYIYTLIKPVGVIGGAAAWGLGVPFIAMLVDALNRSDEFIFQSFQNFPVFPFLLFGTVVVLVSLAKRFRFGWIPSVVVGLAVIVQALDYGVTTSPGHVRWATSQISAAQSAQLRRALAMTPSSAEVIATIGIMGRFSARPWVYWFAPNSPIPVHTRQVEFVFFPAIEWEIPEAKTADDVSAVAFVSTHLHARTVVNRDGVFAFEWRVPPGTTALTIPRG